MFGVIDRLTFLERLSVRTSPLLAGRMVLRLPARA